MARQKTEHILSPQQERFLSLYTNPKSKTFGNARQSALLAGYTMAYANNIMAHLPGWLVENVGSATMLLRAEKNLAEVQNLSIVEVRDGVENIRTDILRERTKVDTFIAERLNKAKYSTRQEVTGKDGEPLNILTDEQITSIAERAIAAHKNASD
jgi:hypothetical protein